VPRIKEETRERRRRRILESAWRCFAENGFHATSMDDVIAATGMSASSVYRYISGKDELIASAIDESIRVIEGLLDAQLSTDPVPSPAETLRALVREGRGDANVPRSRMAIQAWAEALRNPALAKQFATFHRRLREQFTELAHRWRESGFLAPDADPEAYAYVLSILIPGLLVNHELVGEVDISRLVDGMVSAPPRGADLRRKAD
jgi:AcrR family transcriptional regulator